MSKMIRTTLRPALAIVLGATAVACGGGQSGAAPRVVQPGAPGQDSKVVTTSAANPGMRHTEADARFMQGMIGHHAQALEMTALLRTRSTSEPMKLLALRIEVSQADEIKLMQQWLAARGLAVPDEHAHHLPGATLMPGMLTTDEMKTLAAASGAEFDRLFLESMIRHHEGALAMVKQLFDSPGAGQDADIFAFASDVEADQQMEINRMRLMLRGVR